MKMSRHRCRGIMSRSRVIRSGTSCGHSDADVQVRIHEQAPGRHARRSLRVRHAIRSRRRRTNLPQSVCGSITASLLVRVVDVRVPTSPRRSAPSCSAPRGCTEREHNFVFRPSPPRSRAATCRGNRARPASDETCYRSAPHRDPKWCRRRDYVDHVDVVRSSSTRSCSHVRDLVLRSASSAASVRRRTPLRSQRGSRSSGQVRHVGPPPAPITRFVLCVGCSAPLRRRGAQRTRCARGASNWFHVRHSGLRRDRVAKRHRLDVDDRGVCGDRLEYLVFCPHRSRSGRETSAAPVHDSLLARSPMRTETKYLQSIPAHRRGCRIEPGAASRPGAARTPSAYWRPSCFAAPCAPRPLPAPDDARRPSMANAELRSSDRRRGGQRGDLPAGSASRCELVRVRVSQDAARGGTEDEIRTDEQLRCCSTGHIDVVDVVTGRNTSRSRWRARGGKHVLVEKPVAHDFATRCGARLAGKGLSEVGFTSVQPAVRYMRS